MPATEINVQQIAKAGTSPTFEAADVDGNLFLNDGKTFLVVKNGGAAEVTVTIDSLIKCSQGFDHNAQVAVVAAEEKWIGPFETNRFNNAQGKATVTYSGVTNVTVAAVRV